MVTTITQSDLSLIIGLLFWCATISLISLVLVIMVNSKVTKLESKHKDTSKK